MNTDDAERFAFEDFTGTITCDWTSPEIELEMVFDDRLRTAWREVPIRDIELREVETEEHDDADGNEVTPVPRCAYMAIPLGRVTATRRTIEGRVDELGRHDFELRAEPGPFGELTRDTTPGKHATLWSDTAGAAFVKVARSLCDGALPPDLGKMPTAPRALSAEALIRSGHAEGGAEMNCPDLDDYWDPRFQLDVERLLAALERGETHHRPRVPDVEPSRWGVIRWKDGGARLVFPLVTEVFCIEVLIVPEPRYLTARYFLAIDIDSRGELESVSVRAARDGTFDMETDDSAAIFADRDPPEDRESLGSRLNETAYRAISWVVEDFARADPELADEPADPEPISRGPARHE
jgi:hypothetical protein